MRPDARSARTGASAAVLARLRAPGLPAVRIPAALALLPALALARVLPDHGVGLALRLAVATALVLAPGWLLARAFGAGTAAGLLAWSGVTVAAALVVAFALGGSLSVALVVLGALAFAAAALARRRGRPAPEGERGSAWMLALGVLFGAALWRVAGPLEGDALFHLGRVRKLDELDGLSLEAVGEFADGGLHPGYAFPLWHGFLALVGRVAGVEPDAALLHEASILAPLAVLVVYEAGRALFASPWGGLAAAAAQVALAGFAPGHGGVYASLALPGGAARLLLAPALVALFFSYLARPSRGLLASLAAAGVVLALVHSTYVVFVAITLAGFGLARALLARSDVRATVTALAASSVAAGAALLWLLPIVRGTASHEPSGAELERGLRRYADQLDVVSESSYRLAPELFSRGGAVAVAALLVIPLAALAWRTRWAAFVLGGSLLLLGLTLVRFAFPHFADLVSLSQARRAAGFLPHAFALAGGALVLARLVGVAVLPLALAAGIALQLTYPGDFDAVLDDGGPALATWTAAVGGAAALALAAVVRRPRWAGGRERLAALAVAAFVTPVLVHGAARWNVDERPRAHTLTPGLVSALRAQVEERQVVFSDMETSYRILAAAPVYVAAAPPAHVADTTDNRPYERRADALEFLRTGRLEIPRRYGAEWVVIDRSRYQARFHLPLAYSDARFELYRLPPA